MGVGKEGTRSETEPAEIAGGENGKGVLIGEKEGLGLQ